MRRSALATTSRPNVSPDIGRQPPSGSISAAPVSVIVADVTALTKREGTSLLICRVARSPCRRADDRSDHIGCCQRKPLRTRANDDEHPGEAGCDGKPAPPAHALAEKQRGTERDGERQRLEDRCRVGERHRPQRGHIGDRREDLGDKPQQDGRLQDYSPGPEGAHPMGDKDDEHRRHQTAHEENLAGVHRRGDGFDEGVVAGEACHGDDHEQSAPGVSGDIYAGDSRAVCTLIG